MPDIMLSVVVTAYNRAEYIQECIASIQNQTFKDIEIIVIDDCSIDNTEEIVKKLQDDDKRIKYIKHDINKGAGAAKNTGIQNAVGKYLTFVDSDDKLANIYAYETAVNTLETMNIDVYAYDYTQSPNVELNSKYKMYGPNINYMNRVTTMLPLKLFKTKQIQKVKNNEKIKFDDVPFWVDFCLTNRPIIYQSYNKFYIINEDTTRNSITRNEHNYIEIFESYNELNKILNLKGNDLSNNKEILYNIINDSIMYLFVQIFDDAIREQYRIKAKNYIKSLDSTCDIIGKEISLKNLAFFIDDETVRNKYLRDIEIFKLNRYRYIKPNEVLFKINREFKRILLQIKKLIDY